MSNETTPQTSPETANGESVPLKPEATTDETAAPSPEPVSLEARVDRLERAFARLIADPKEISADPKLITEVRAIASTPEI